jgi:hypothetical protein
VKYKLWWIGAGGLLAIGLLSGFLKEAAEQRKATAQAIISRVESRPLLEIPEGERAVYLSELARTVNRLSFEERRQLALRRGLDSSFEQMTDAEKKTFLNQTLPQGFSQIIEVFNKMKPEERRLAVERALDDLKRAEASASDADWSRAQDRLEDGTLQQVVEQGFQSYLQTASAETKLDLAPVIEQIQQNVRSLHRR